MRTLLIVEDNAEIRKQLKWGLSKEYTLLFADSSKAAVKLAEKHKPPVVTLDLGLPPDEEGVTEGFCCLEEISRVSPRTKVIVITGRDEKQNALQAVLSGAYDYYPKPIDLGVLKIILERAFYLYELEEENARLQEQSAGAGELAGMFGQSPAMLEVFSTIRKVASVDVPVLILGESGTGKEMVAHALHAHSPRKSGPFISINCGAIPETLLESELFGHEKGSFTGAHALMRGKVEQAEGGTLFLDEIAEMSPALQVKLLRFLQDNIVQRVGGRADIPVDVRVIAATNVEIDEAIQKGNFRDDLYYRISVVSINLPPLRNRGEDILLLANLFLHKYAGEYNKKVRSISIAALRELKSYEWPGNVRELENRFKRAVVMAESAIIDPKSLGFDVSDTLERKTAIESCLNGTSYNLEGLSLKEARDQIERDLVLLSLERENGNVSKAANILGVTRPTLYDLMKKHNLIIAEQKNTP